MNSNVHFSSERDDWATPWPFFHELDHEFSFSLDVCATAHNAKCEQFFSPEDDALKRCWTGTCFMNPPYGRGIGAWIAKAFEESQRGALVVCLLPSRTDTKWWHEYVMRANEIRFIRGRLKFDGHENSAPFPSAIVVFSREARQHPHVITMEAKNGRALNGEKSQQAIFNDAQVEMAL